MVKTKYVGFGPTLASEKLRERNGIHLSSETLRKWLIEEGVWKGKKKKKHEYIKDERGEAVLENYFKEMGLRMTGLREAQRSVASCNLQMMGRQEEMLEREAFHAL